MDHDALEVNRKDMIYQMKKRVPKGSYGYIDYQKKFSIIRTIVFFAISLAVYAIGYYSTKSSKNLLTVVAVLGCLPACKSLVNVVMFMRATGCSRPAWEKISQFDDKLIGFYDMYFTSYQQNYAISHMVIKGNMVCAYTESATCESSAGEKHIEQLLRQDGYKNITVKIFNNQDKYIDRLGQLEKLELEDDKELDNMIRMFYSVTL